jgi:isopenicillin-N epimerase
MSPLKNTFREQWSLESGLAFLNHGSFGACPRAVVEEQARLRVEMERNPVRFLWREIERRLDTARNDLAHFVSADPGEIAFVPNATSAVNAVLRSFSFQPGDEIIVTDHGYNACNNIAAECALRSGAKVIFASVPFPTAGPEQALAAIFGVVTPRTRLVLVDHVTSPTALVLPVAEIIRELEPRGIAVFVDGAHAPGMVPLDLRALRPSFYTGNLHKWVCAPRGAGFMFARADRQQGLHPAVISHGYNTPRAGRSRFHDEFDWQGTLDMTAWLAVPMAIRFCESLMPGGWSALMLHNHNLACTARRLLCERLGVEAPCPEAMLGSMATIPLPDALQEKSSGEPRAMIARMDALQCALLDRHHIEIPVVRWGVPPRRWIRISTHAYNSPVEYTHLADALSDEVVAQRGSTSMI